MFEIAPHETKVQAPVSSPMAQASLVEAMPYFLARASTPRMRRTAVCPSALCMAWHNAPICGPANSALSSNCSVESGVREGRSCSWMRCRARCCQMFAQQLPGARIHQSHMCVIPLRLNAAADPARRSAVIRRFDFHAAIQMDCTFAVLVVAKRFQRQGQRNGRSSANMAATCRLVVP